MFGALLWLSSPAWDAIESHPELRFIRPLVVIDLIDLCATNMNYSGCLGLLHHLLQPIPDGEYLPFY